MTQKQPTTTADPQLKDFEELVHTVIRESKVPGVAVLLIKDGNVHFSQGFGKRNVAEDLAVTPRTLFPIGSSSKAFTAIAIAMLVEEGKLEWDTPLQHYLPSFKLHDAFATERMTPRDLLCHRSGLPRHDALWYGSRLTRKEVVERLAHLEPSADFRARYQYNNLMFVTAGYLIEHVTDQTWETFVTERILKPLGMNASTLSPQDSQQTDDYSLPYREEKEEMRKIPFYDQWQITGPAGGINSNLEDISKWLLFHLNQGKHGETQLLTAAQLAQNHTPHTVMPAGSTTPFGKHPEIANWSYGMGWMVGSYKGHCIVQHGGSIDGFMAEVALLPDDNAALAIFSNKDGLAVGPNSGRIVPYIIAFSACDYLLGLDATDWHGRLRAEGQHLSELLEKQMAELHKVERVPNAPPSHPLEAYTGTYEHPGYGTMTITQAGEQLHCSYNTLSASLTHLHYDIFEWSIERLQFKSRVSFATGEKGAIENLAVKLEPAVKAQIFIRVPNSSTTM